MFWTCLMGKSCLWKQKKSILRSKFQLLLHHSQLLVRFPKFSFTFSFHLFRTCDLGLIFSFFFICSFYCTNSLAMNFDGYLLISFPLILKNYGSCFTCISLFLPLFFTQMYENKYLGAWCVMSIRLRDTLIHKYKNRQTF